MQQITLRLDEDTIESLDREAEERGESRSEYLRDIIASRREGEYLRKGHAWEVHRIRREHEREVAEYERELDHLRAKVDDLQRQLAAANRRIDTTNELVRYVEDERTAEQRRREAGLLTRTKWWLTGMPDDRDG